MNKLLIVLCLLLIGCNSSAAPSTVKIDCSNNNNGGIIIFHNVSVNYLVTEGLIFYLEDGSILYPPHNCLIFYKEG